MGFCSGGVDTLVVGARVITTTPYGIWTGELGIVPTMEFCLQVDGEPCIPWLIQSLEARNYGSPVQLTEFVQFRGRVVVQCGIKRVVPYSSGR